MRKRRKKIVYLYVHNIVPFSERSKYASPARGKIVFAGKRATVPLRNENATVNNSIVHSAYEAKSQKNIQK